MVICMRNKGKKKKTALFDLDRHDRYKRFPLFIFLYLYTVYDLDLSGPTD